MSTYILYKFHHLYDLATALDRAWGEGDAVDWADAERLVSECRSIVEKLLPAPNSVRAIVAYTTENKEWDNGIVANWPQNILSEISVTLPGDKNASQAAPVEILKELVNDIEVTGGLSVTEVGRYAPAGNQNWTDLGSTVKKAHDWLAGQGYSSELTINQEHDE